MPKNVGDRLRLRTAQQIKDLTADIAERGEAAAVDFVRSRLSNLPRKGAANNFSDGVLDALLRLELLSEDILIGGLCEEQSHKRVLEWIVKNAEQGSDVINAVMARLARGEQFLETRRGPKYRADGFFQDAVKAVAQMLNEAGVALYANQGNTRFSAAEVISEVLRKEGDLPISPSLVRDWIS
ncbi:MAG: hypothetical protein RIQ99_384 [Pseudomonadota bacterium]|jgi:subtilisin family serine protease